ncbi:hypothetical protein OU995_01635 [Roseateles sp. SL47]|uniref:CbiQ family ECF transporter T component n=1 Tax=Roseateles sp. SL47 TaxID=2995138 RepID=UPI00226D7BEA|nr:CbiQ family ECF transporter T component [Roseateles sp. SL47]WAC73477.1 hypothetical protein OU995_01635 [Roseateles sp. SL47]
MSIERLAYASRWRPLAPSAKALFCGGAMAAAWLAASPWTTLALAGLMATLTVVAAGVPMQAYLKVALAPLGFLCISCLTMLVTLAPGNSGLHWRLAPELLPQVAMIVSRAAALCTTLLLLVLTTPLGDLLGLLRRLHVPALLLDLMALAYRMQAVLAEAMQDGLTAQRARLGYGGRRQALRSSALLISRMAVQIWARASALQAAADARNFNGELRVLPASYPRWRLQCAVAVLGGLVLIAGAAWVGAAGAGSGSAA